MGSFSIWHLLILVGGIAIVLLPSITGMARHPIAPDSAGIHVHSPTQYICASLHTGIIDPQDTIDRLTDRHKARLPEVGVNTTRILQEARTALSRRGMFSALMLLPTAWLALFVGLQLSALIANEATIAELVLGLVPPLLLIAFIAYVEKILIDRHLKATILTAKDRPDKTEIDNVVIFGGWSPFAGYGLDHVSWSFVTDVTRPEHEHGHAPQELKIAELLDHLSKSLKDNNARGTMLDKLFVNGCRIREQALFLYNATAIPNTVVSESIMRSRIGLADEDVRHYRLFSMPFCAGHAHLTIFIRATRVGDDLFFELHSHVLGPISPRFTVELNELPVRRGIGHQIGLIAQNLVVSPFIWVRGVAWVMTMIGKLERRLVIALRGHPEDKLKVRQHCYNYGRTTSLREGWASNTLYSYFQVIDRDMASKTSQYVIVAALKEFFESKGISTADIEERSTMIFNSGVMISGSEVNAQQIAVGAGATARSVSSHRRESAKVA